jgi:O-antigen/teichoic acid export membrane protein
MNEKWIQNLALKRIGTCFQDTYNLIKNTIIKNIFLNKYTGHFFNEIMNNALWKGAFIIGSGTAIAQVIGVVTVPIITRLYSPSDYGILGVYSSILAILLVFASLRYEFAIPLPENESTTLNLCMLCIVLMIVICTIISITILLVGNYIAGLFNIELIMPYFWLLPIGLFGGGIYSILSYWAIRQRDYVTITHTRINQSISGAISKISIGAIIVGPIGLLIGEIFSNAAGIGTLGKKFWMVNKSNLKEISFNNMKHVARKYWNFPIFTVPAQLIGSIGAQLPVLALTTIYGTSVTGLYILAYSIISLPSMLISASISRPFYAETAKNVRENPSLIMPQFVETVKTLTYLSIPLIVIPTIFSPFLFPIIFGDSWKDAGIYALPLALAAVPYFIAIPTSKLALYNCNHWELGFHIANTSLLTLGFFIVYKLNLSAFLALTIYGSITGFMCVILIFLNIAGINRIVLLHNS